MTTPDPKAVESLPSILGQHRYVDVRGDYESGDRRRYFGCSCGWTRDIGGMSGYWSWVGAHERHIAEAVLAAGYATPAQVKQAKADALTGALEDICQRRQNFRRLNADPQYLAAMDDAFGLVNNRIRRAQEPPC